MILQTIPARDIVAVNPQVVSGGGASLGLNGVCLTQSTRVPIGQVIGFVSQASVAAYFGALPQKPANLTSFLDEVEQFANTDYATALLAGSKISTLLCAWLYQL